MGSNKDDKKKQQQLEEQQRQDRALFTQTFQQANTKSPLELAREKESLDWINDTTGVNGPFDIMKVRGMAPSLSAYSHSAADQQRERQGIGALRMGLNATSPEAAANLATQDNLRRDQERGGRLEQAFAAKDASMRGDVMPLLGLQNNRNMGLAGLAGSQSGNSTGLWSQFRVRPSGWATFGQNLLQGAAQAGSAALGNPNLFS